ncbi:MAG: hypothetical protein JWN49_685 [Parcubacteria group bacterium]|nr:hypothetical protein [Parcubacteria group bacterium]
MSKENLVAIVFGLIILLLIILSTLAHPSSVPLPAILGIYFAILTTIVVNSWRKRAHMKDPTKGTVHVGRGLLILFMIAIGAIFGYTSAHASGELVIPNLRFFLLGGIVLLIVYFGGNWLRSRSDFFGRFFDRPLVTNSISLYSLILFAFSAIYGILAGATLFSIFGV